VVSAVGFHLRFDTVSRAAEREFAQSDEVAGAEEVGGGKAGLIREVDLAFVHPAAQLVDGKVNDLNVGSLIQDGVRDGFAHRDAGDLGDHIVEAVEVLDVEGGIDVDAGIDQFDDILPAFGVAAARGVGVGEFVHQDEAGVAGKRGVEIELFESDAAMRHTATRQEV
jgi:hypothetical protein